MSTALLFENSYLVVVGPDFRGEFEILGRAGKHSQKSVLQLLVQQIEQRADF